MVDKFDDLIKNGMAGIAIVSKEEAAQIPVLVLAYVGDAVYELFVRSWIVATEQVPVKQLHKHAVAFVSAKAQCASLMKIADMLSETEQDIVRRGRNSKTTSSPKNVSIVDYRHATAFEVLIGYLYLSGQMQRLYDIIKLTFSDETKNGEK